MILAGQSRAIAARARVGHERVARDSRQHFGQLDPVGERQE